MKNCKCKEKQKETWEKLYKLEKNWLYLKFVCDTFSIYLKVFLKRRNKHFSNNIYNVYLYRETHRNLYKINTLVNIST